MSTETANQNWQPFLEIEQRYIFKDTNKKAPKILLENYNNVLIKLDVCNYRNICDM